MSLSITDLHFSYPNKTVLRGVDISLLPCGKVTALLGPNAAGKSTLFRCITGLLSLQTGGIELAGESLLSQSQAARIRHVCYMPQSYESRAALTVFEVVLLASKQLDRWQVVDEDVEKVALVLEQFGISHLAERFIGELSGGQQQIVSLCQSVVRSAQLYLLDEPTSALDLRHQLQVMQTLVDVTKQRDVTTVIALHDLNLAARFADHLVLMNEGVIVASGSPDTILSSPELAQIYGVDIELHRGSDGVLVVGSKIGTTEKVAVEAG